MAQKEVIEFIAKVDDQTNQVVPTNQTNTPVPNPPIPVDVGAGAQDALTNSLQKESAEAQLENAIKSSIFREAALKALKEINDDIEASLSTGAGGNQPPIDPPTDIPTAFFDPEDNGEIPDYERLAQQQQDAIDDLINSFDKIDNGSIDPQRFDETTAEFDKTFADMDAVEDTMASLTESLEKPLELLGIAAPELVLFIKGVAGATAAVSGLVVATQLYSSVLAATVENFGELSAELKDAQAETEIARVQQQLEFAEEFGDVLADMERNRNELRDAMREFLGSLLASAAPFIDATTAGFTALMTVLNTILSWLQPAIEILKFQMAILEGIYKTITWIANAANPFKWFDSNETGDNSSVWDNLTAPENFLNVDNIRPTNMNGRDVFDMDDLMKKNL